MRMTCAIFDMDGTLIDSMWKWDEVTFAPLKRFGRTPDEAFHAATIAMPMPETVEYAIRTFDLPITPEEYLEEVDREMARFYREEVACKEGVLPLLRLLKMEGVQLYTATATDRSLVETALDRCGIRQYFKGIITCSEVGESKAEGPKIYEYAMKRMGGNKQNTVIFEDSWAAIQTAKKAGFRVAAVYDNSSRAFWEEMKALADYAYESFGELLESQESK